MKLEEAIQTAIEYETRVRDAYRQAAAGASDPIGKKVLGALADEEQGHLDYLQAKLAQWQETGRLVAEELKTVVPSPAAIESGLAAKDEERPTRAADTAEIAFLEEALALEQETSAFYKRMVDELPEDDRPMFARFEEIEDGHVAIVQAELDNLRGLGYWFDHQEFDLERG